MATITDSHSFSGMGRRGKGQNQRKKKNYANVILTVHTWGAFEKRKKKAATPVNRAEEPMAIPYTDHFPALFLLSL